VAALEVRVKIEMMGERGPILLHPLPLPPAFNDKHISVDSVDPTNPT
jgi:hypothetical protein